MSRPRQLYSAYIFDLDGTIYLGESALPTAVATVNALRQHGCRTLFVSNNPTHSAADYARRLSRLGLPTTPADIIHSSRLMADYLRQHLPGARLLVIGEAPLQRELVEAGFVLTTDAMQTDAVIASFDRSFAYWKLQAGFDAIRRGARFLATNSDRYCPTPGGGQPDAGAVIAAIEGCTGVPVEVVVGKPSPFVTEEALRRMALPAEQCLVVGDRLETDIQMGLNAGMATALVLTGATGAEALLAASIRPSYVLDELAELLPPGQ
jgi:NagD protein